MNEPSEHPSEFRQSAENINGDTVETSLADDLLSTDETQELGSAAVPPMIAHEEDDDYLAPEGRRSRWTTGLAVALIFTVGMLCGVVLSKTLSPPPPTQVVYLLNDAGRGSANPIPPGGMPSRGPSPTGTPR